MIVENQLNRGSGRISGIKKLQEFDELSTAVAVSDQGMNVIGWATVAAEILMDPTVARLNIEHFRKLLSQEKDEAKRQTILRLLAEEEAKLASLSNPPEKKFGS
jgi:hypothetical protein